MIDIQKIAVQAGFKVKNFKPPVITAQHSNGSWVSVGDELVRFAALYREAVVQELVAGSGEPYAWGDAGSNWCNRTPRRTFVNPFPLYTADQLAGAVLRERQKAVKLWMLLDDVDTADDIAKADDKLYRGLCQQYQKKRWEILSGEEVDAAAIRSGKCD